MIGFTSVVGDLLHSGHVIMLNECKRYCDYLYVGLIIDPTTDRPEKHKPIQSAYERYTELRAHRAVDEVIPLSGEKDLELALMTLPIDIRFVGEEYKLVDFTGRRICEKRGIRIFYNNRSHGLSSSELRKRVYDEESKLCGSNTKL